MRAGEVRAAGQIAGTVLAGGVGLVRDVHLSVADRVFRAIGPRASAVRLAHDGVSRVVYGAVGEVHRWAPRVAATAGALTVSPDAVALDATKGGNTTLGAINGLWGDRLVAADSELAVGMTIRHDGVDVPIERAALCEVFPDATGRLAVFVHGLCETESAWWPSERKQRTHGALNFGRRVAEMGFTPLYVRYNSGLHISDNGARLSRLLEDVTNAWPMPVDEVVLIGHSMGGLVARSACHQADQLGAGWVARTRHVFGLGTPHLGAPLERGVNALAWSLGKLPETRGLAGVLNARSVGVKDLRFGSLLEADWTDVDLDGFLTGRATEVPFLPHVSYYFIGATVTRNRNHPLGLLVGDLLVQFRSASGNGHRRRLPFDINNGHHVGGLNHFDLLSHPDVYNQLQHWLRALDADDTNQTIAAPTAGLATNPTRLLSDIDA